MFYFTRNFERQKLRLQKVKKIYNTDADVHVTADADAEMPMPRFPNGHKIETYSENVTYLNVPMNKR